MTVSDKRNRAAAKLMADVHAITAKEGITPSALHALKLKLVALAAKKELFPLADFAKPVAEGVRRNSLLIAAGTALLLALALAWGLGPMAALLGLAGLALGHLAMRRVFERKLGGYTGDCLGSVQQGSELGFYLGILAWL